MILFTVTTGTIFTEQEEVTFEVENQYLANLIAVLRKMENRPTIKPYIHAAPHFIPTLTVLIKE